MSALLAGTSAGLVVALLLPEPAHLPGPPRRRSVLLLALASGVLAVASAQEVALGLVVLGLAAGALRMLRRAREARTAGRYRTRVVELCDALQAELAAGQSAEQALGRAAEDWPLVGPAARAAATGGDVTNALRDLATVPGAASLRIVAAAWLVAHRTGHGLADALGRVADDLRAAEQTHRIVAGELASARATARLLAGLPVVALAMGAGAGASPWAFLVGSPAGLVCLVTGLGLGYAGLAWVDALAAAIDRDA